MLQLYFIRHGETEWNRQNRLQGRLDSNLTSDGVNDARLLAERLRSIPFDAVVTSPSVRAVQTAKLLIENRDVPVEMDKRLMEIHLGAWQGKTLDEIKKIDPHRYECYYNRPELYKNDSGESFLDVKARLEAVLQDLEGTYQSGNILIVTHGVVIKVLQMICKNIALGNLWEPPLIDGTSVSIVKVEEGRRELLLEGDISHKIRLNG